MKINFHYPIKKKRSYHLHTCLDTPTYPMSLLSWPPKMQSTLGKILFFLSIICYFNILMFGSQDTIFILQAIFCFVYNTYLFHAT
jgi:hypothetical protein